MFGGGREKIIYNNPFFLIILKKRKFNSTDVKVNPAKKPIQIPAAPILKVNAIMQPVGIPITQ
jgi:hypothetical protein